MKQHTSEKGAMISNPFLFRDIYSFLFERNIDERSNHEHR